MKAQDLAWDDFRTMLAACREGTLSGAARVLGVNHSTVFRRVNALEDKLGVRLFERLPEGYAMTEAGESVREACERIENEVFGLSRKLIGRDLRLHGTLRITAPDAFAIKLLTPLLVQFSRQYPDIRLELSMSNHYLARVVRSGEAWDGYCTTSVLSGRPGKRAATAYRSTGRTGVRTVVVDAPGPAAYSAGTSFYGFPGRGYRVRTGSDRGAHDRVK